MEKIKFTFPSGKVIYLDPEKTSVFSYEEAKKLGLTGNPEKSKNYSKKPEYDPIDEMTIEELVDKINRGEE